MNDKDKILINSYLDNEVSQEEYDYIEKLIINDEEAKNYYEELKELNLRLDVYSKDEKQLELNRNIKDFVHMNIKPKLKKKGSEGMLDLLFNSTFNNIIGYSFTAIVFFGIGSGILNNNVISGFNSTYIDIEYLKLRNNEPQKFNEIIIDATSNMINQKSSNANLYIGEERYQISLNSFKEPCYYGELSKANENLDFVVCISKDEKNLTFID